MLKQATVYQLDGLPTHYTLSQMLSLAPFAPTAPTQELSAGWLPPREAHGTYLEAIAGHWVALFVYETRSVPTAALQKRVDAMADELEKLNGRRPGKKMLRELKDEARRELLPQAFPKRSEIPVWIDPGAGLLVVGTASASKADRAASDLSRIVDGLMVRPAVTLASPEAVLGEWLLDAEAADAAGFAVGRTCELRAHDETRAKVRFTHHALVPSVLREHLATGKTPHALELSHNAGRVSFVLDTSTLALRGIELLGLEVGIAENPADDAFDADVTLTTGALAPALADLFRACGGLMGLKLPEPAGQPAPVRDDELSAAA